MGSWISHYSFISSYGHQTISPGSPTDLSCVTTCTLLYSGVTCQINSLMKDSARARSWLAIYLIFGFSILTHLLNEETIDPEVTIRLVAILEPHSICWMTCPLTDWVLYVPPWQSQGFPICFLSMSMASWGVSKSSITSLGSCHQHQDEWQHPHL